MFLNPFTGLDFSAGVGNSLSEGPFGKLTEDCPKNRSSEMSVKSQMRLTIWTMDERCPKSKIKIKDAFINFGISRKDTKVVDWSIVTMAN